MPGWLIQGVRGEGKSLCAVGRIKHYLEQGRVVATNLDLNLEKLVRSDNSTLVYRLPDKPRIEDLELLPPAYDLDYKSEDKNGLLVLDELGTWLNTRTFKDKGRLDVLNWLFLSRKYHWDIILLAQDNEQIDKQARTTLCDYLVQASRLDRQKIPFLAPLLEFFFISSYMPKVHVYHVYYGFSFQQKPVEVWKFTGKDIYDGYDTNQRFLDGAEILNGKLVDMRATYTYLPASYLSGHVYKKRLLDEIERIEFCVSSSKKKKKNNLTIDGNKNMAAKTGAFGDKPKIILLSVFLIGFLVWRFGFHESSVPGSGDSVPVSSNDVKNIDQVDSSSGSVFSFGSSSDQKVTVPNKQLSLNQPPDKFVDTLLMLYRPRIGTMIYSNVNGAQGYVEFYEGYDYRERLSFKELHALGVSAVKKPYGIDLITSTRIVAVTAWPVPRETTPFLVNQESDISKSDSDKSKSGNDA